MRASGFQIGDSDGSSYGSALKVLQEEIDAVDRAIEEEKRLGLAHESESAAQSRRPKPRILKRA